DRTNRVIPDISVDVLHEIQRPMHELGRSWRRKLDCDDRLTHCRRLSAGGRKQTISRRPESDARLNSVDEGTMPGDMATKVIDAPPWLVRLMTPLFARTVVRDLQKEHPEITLDQALEKMRADLGPNPDEAGLRMLEEVRARWPSAAPSVDTEAAAAASTWHS